jgi:hypothetical protein
VLQNGGLTATRQPAYVDEATLSEPITNLILQGGTGNVKVVNRFRNIGQAFQRKGLERVEVVDIVWRNTKSNDSTQLV